MQCFNQEDVNAANDEFQLKSSNTDGVCITSLSINGNHLSVGRDDHLQSFWIDTDERYCLYDYMSTSQITLKNGQVDSSDCKPLGQSGVTYCK